MKTIFHEKAGGAWLVPLLNTPLKGGALFLPNNCRIVIAFTSHPKAYQCSNGFVLLKNEAQYLNKT